MATIVTNRGLKLMLQWVFQAISEPAKYYAILLPSGAAATVDVNTISDTSEIPAGHGYTSGGVEVTRNNSGFINLTEDDTNDWATIEFDNINFVTSGGAIPATGDIRYMAITTDEATVADRQILLICDLGSSITVPDGKYLKVYNEIVNLAHP